MPTSEKKEKVAEIKERFDRAAAVILFDYRGLSVKDMQLLRRQLAESGCELKIFKNTLTQIAVRELKIPDLGTMLEGPSAFTFCDGDPVVPSGRVGSRFGPSSQLADVPDAKRGDRQQERSANRNDRRNS